MSIYTKISFLFFVGIGCMVSVIRLEAGAGAYGSRASLSKIKAA